MLTNTFLIPASIAFFAAVSTVFCAAKGVLLRDPLNPKQPELHHETAFPCLSEKVTNVLLKVDFILTIPSGIFFFSLRFTFTLGPAIFNLLNYLNTENV